MKILSSIYPHIVFPLCVLISIKALLDFANENSRKYWWSVFIRVYNFENPSETENVSSFSFQSLRNTTDRTSSVFCRGSNHTDRLCSFINLCYEPENETFVFFSGPRSIRSGLPHDRFSPALADFSSVEDHNTLYFNYIEVPLSAADKFNFSLIDGHALVFKRFHPENLMHVFHDDLIPVFATLQELSFSDMFLVFADEWQPGPYASLYENFLKETPLYLHSLSQNHLHCFENIHVGLNKLPTWYQYGFKVPQGPLPKLGEEIAPVIHAFRDYFLERFAPHLNPEEEHAVLFSRKHNRKIINEREVVERISQITGLHSHVLSLDTDNILEIVRSLGNCRVAVGMHGSLLILSLFLDPGSLLVEAFPFGIQSLDVTPYRTLSWILGLTYRAWENNLEVNTHPHPEYPAVLGGLEQLAPEESERIRSSVVTPFLCCEDRVWLYRIYQDTTVNVDSFTGVLQDGLDQCRGLHPPKLIDNDKIEPSDVTNVSCVMSNMSLTLVWSPPWNLGFVNASLVEYEVWLQEIETEELRAFLVKQRQLVVSVKSDQNATYYAWVRCYANGRVGPFSSSPIVCKSPSVKL